MRFLLDTHCWLWLQTAPERLSQSLLETMADGSSDLYLSAASAWEIGTKHATGRLPLPAPPAVYVAESMRRSGVTGLPISHIHALTAAALPQHHRDPFDRVLVAQAQVEGLTLVTADAILERYDVPMVRVR